MIRPFHLAIQVRDIDEARTFYGDQLGFGEGRSAAGWVDWDMFGHQLVTHLNPALGPNGKVPVVRRSVDEHGVPVPHFGVVLDLGEWDELRMRLEAFVSDWIIAPYARFAGQAGEQRTLFLADPSGNALEFKAFADVERDLFRT
jgi:hypothetical protein